ncbi:nuclear transport factor 2 family protein [Lentzea tibetensis]|uniref:Nuclear transport factor 2 family protein n=1 Tax=Lentzea tibetensis TaxID=2591470 RepID=A0A563ES91_9PSEU|nr:nuclear transport factor 2 family protein [Lentzea tibetensis]TWP50462.1 nuclear transport factor 2 family protein [Lentzea tibetensis]
MPDAEQAIERLVNIYFQGVDTKDEALYRTIWADDAVFTMFADPDGTGGVTHVGIDACAATVRGAFGFAASVHAKGNFVANVASGLTATASTLAVANVVLPATATEPSKVLVRGIHYRDEFVRTADGWKISKRIHAPLWQFDQLAVPVGLPPA